MNLRCVINFEEDWTEVRLWSTDFWDGCLSQTPKMAAERPAKLDYKSRLLVDQIVQHIKSQGIFDQFRRDCTDELEQKVGYSYIRYIIYIYFNYIIVIYAIQPQGC